jgi:predicted AlkP superfamily phosphohydrolase/phosphomutase
MPPLARVLVIGLDAADRDLILRWTREGDLPVMRRLLETSHWGMTVNPPGLYVGAVWPSFFTGVSPARHGRYCYVQLNPGTYRARKVHTADLRVEPFWERLSRAGKRVAVIDVPKTPLSRGVNGLHIVDWGTHDPDHARVRTWPEALAAEVAARFGEDPLRNCNGHREHASEYAALRDALVARARRKAELARHYLEQGGWDAFVAVFSESHCAGHQCWHLLDPDHPRHDPEVARAAGNPMRDVYRAIDRGIGELLELAGDETLTVVLASHGMGPHYDGTFLLGKILERLGAQAPARPHPRLRRWLRGARRRLPGPLGRGVRPLLEWVKAAEVRPLGRGTCFQVPNNDAHGGIRVNLIGREPRGRVRPGKEYEAFCGTLARDLLELRNADTGMPLVRSVMRIEDLYPGERLDHLPDLIIEWERSAPVRAVESPKIGRIEGRYEKCRTGDHTGGGLFFLSGPGVAPGRRPAPVEVTDFAATFLAHLGVDPSPLDGSPIVPAAAAGTSC